MIIQYVQIALYITAFLITACIHLLWNDLVKSAVGLIVHCLAKTATPILLSMLKLHCLVIAFFFLAVCFRATSAIEIQHDLTNQNLNCTLDFDDLPTSGGFGNTPRPYHHLSFNLFNPFDPHDSHFKGRISPNDLNCAVSLPIALYGARISTDVEGDRREVSRSMKPTLMTNVTSLHDAGLAPFFTLHSLKIKPLDIPFSYTTLSIRGYRHWTGGQRLEWHVEFPQGYHDVLHVKFEDFTKQLWDKLEMVEIYADFGWDDSDWEFCLDDIEVEFSKLESEHYEDQVSPTIVGLQEEL